MRWTALKLEYRTHFQYRYIYWYHSYIFLPWPTRSKRCLPITYHTRTPCMRTVTGPVPMQYLPLHSPLFAWSIAWKIWLKTFLDYCVWSHASVTILNSTSELRTDGSNIWCHFYCNKTEQTFEVIMGMKLKLWRRMNFYLKSGSSNL